MARLTIERCTLEECESWADRWKAVATYAAAGRDESLMNAARRLQARAIRRAGELLATIPDGRPQGRPKKGTPRPERPPAPRREAARSAGMAVHEPNRAVRFARIPLDEFEAAIERPKPATLGELDRRGNIQLRKAGGLPDADATAFEAHRSANKARARLRLLGQWLREMTPESRASLIEHSDASQRAELQRSLVRIRRCAKALLAELPPQR